MQLLPADTYHVVIHGVTTFVRREGGKVVLLHASTYPEGMRFKVRLFEQHVRQLIGATLGHIKSKDFSGCQANVTLEIDKALGINRVRKIAKVDRLARVESEVRLIPVEKSFVEFGGV